MARVELLVLCFAVWCMVSADLAPSSSNSSYSLSNIQVSENGVTAIATYIGGPPPAKEVLVSTLFINITYDTPQRLRLRITDNNAARWEVPNDLEPYSIIGSYNNYNVSVVSNPMGIKVTRTSDDIVIFNLDSNTLFTYYDKDIFLSNNLGYNINVLGLGERVAPFILPSGDYTLWARDRPSPYDNGEDGNENMYGSHPFYVIVEEVTGTAFGGFLYNSNAMSALVRPTSLSFRTTGGIIDLWLFIGPTPEDVVFQYQQLIGYPTLIPYWSLGYHQCRYGYNSLADLINVYNNFTLYNIPLDAIWSDIDYMYLYEDFVFDPVRYPPIELEQFVAQLGGNKQYYVPIVDAGIKQYSNYSSYSDGITQNVFISSPYNITNPPTPTVGVVWPGNATFIDWLHPNATKYWLAQLQKFQATSVFKGLWLDMNEASNFIDGELYHSPTIINCTTMPWCPQEDDINARSLDVGAVHYGNVLEYNFHSLYGYYEAKATSHFFTDDGQRPFIITRSSFPGLGRFASKWLGDNYSTWDFLQYSITGIFNFGMFGIPMIGADICGFLGNTNDQLCARWYQLGTLYPFSRNHNDIDSIPQEPWELLPTTLPTSIMSIRNKYMLLLHIYTEMTLLNSNGGMLFKPTYFRYPKDLTLLYNSTASFLLGDSLLVHPALWYDVYGTTSYFPDDNWYDLYTGAYVQLDYDNTAYLDMPLPGLINIHVSQGHIIPLIDNYATAGTAFETRYSNITLLIVRNNAYDAYGSILFDDGATLATATNYAYTLLEYEYYAFNSTFDIMVLSGASLNGYTRKSGEWPYISTIVIYGCTAVPQTVYKFSRGVTTAVNANTYWDLREAVCKIWLGSLLQPDEVASLFISYYI
jgi:alpha-glucosidase (family GH31 glycosyl hydrolase)